MKNIFSTLSVLTLLVMSLFTFFKSAVVLSGLSWTMMYLIPLVFPGVLIAMGLFLFVFKGIKWSGFHALGVLVLGITGYYLYLNPVYQGDLSYERVPVVKTRDNNEMVSWQELNDEQNKLIVYVDYNCPHCKEAVTKLQWVKKRLPKAQIWVSLVQEDTSFINKYKEKTGADLLSFRLNNHPDAAAVYGYRFPTFIWISKNGGEVYKSTNDHMGTKAWDELESFLQDEN